MSAEKASSSTSESTLGAGLCLGPQGQSWGQGTLVTGAERMPALLRGRLHGLGLLIHRTPGNQRLLPRSIGQCVPNLEEAGRREQMPCVGKVLSP